jgi:hypothetical protein
MARPEAGEVGRHLLGPIVRREQVEHQRGKQLELALRTLERAALLARKPKPRQITLTGHVYVANMDEREELSSKATYDKNLVILVHKG